MTNIRLYFYIWVTIFLCLSAGPVPQRHRRITYGSKLQNKLKLGRNAIKTTVPATTTTTMTTLTDLEIERNSSFKSIDDYLNYDYNYLHYFYDLSYDDVRDADGGVQEGGHSEPEDLTNLDTGSVITPSPNIDILKGAKVTKVNESHNVGGTPSEEEITLTEVKKNLPKQKMLLEDQKILLEEQKILLEEQNPLSQYQKHFPEEQKTLPEDQKTLLEEQKTFSQDQKTLNEEQNTLLENQKTLQEDQKTLHEEKKTLSQDQNTLLENQKTLPEDQKTLHEEKKTLSQDQKTLNVEQNTQLENQKTLPEDQKMLHEEQKTLSQDQKTLNEEQNTLLKNQKTLHEEQSTLPENQKSLPEAQKTLHEDQKTLLDERITLPEEQKTLLDERITLPEEGKTLLEVRKILPERRVTLNERRETILRVEKNIFEMGKSRQIKGRPLSEDKTPAQSRESPALGRESPAQGRESHAQVTNRKISVATKELNISQVNRNPEKFAHQADGVILLTNSSPSEREGKLLNHETLLQKTKNTNKKDSDNLNFRTETLPDVFSKGIKPLRYTTQSPEFANINSKSHSLTRPEKLNPLETRANQGTKDEVKVVSEKTVSIDAPQIGSGINNFINSSSSNLGWRSESSVSFEVSVESSRPKGKEISPSFPFRKRIVNVPQRPQENMQLKEELSLEVSATPKITDLMSILKPEISQKREVSSEKLLFTSEHIDEISITTMNSLDAAEKERPTHFTTSKGASTEPTTTSESKPASPPTSPSEKTTNSTVAKQSSLKTTATPKVDSSYATSVNIPATTLPSTFKQKLTLASTRASKESNNPAFMEHLAFESTTASTSLIPTRFTTKTLEPLSNITPTESTPISSRLSKQMLPRSSRRNFSPLSRNLIVTPNANLVPPHLVSQLGMNPHGRHPSGVNPFGMKPQGITPFGISPKGIDPLGIRSQILNATINNSTNLEAQNITLNNPLTEAKPEGAVEERVHVQVTKPDGSINGDYLVLDHNTGSLSGVRYEAIDGADQALIQKALLSFLSLDPRTDPRPKETVGDEPANNLTTNLDLGKTHPETATVKLKPQFNDQS